MLVDSVNLAVGNGRIIGLAKDKTINQIGEIVPIAGVVRWTTPNNIRMLNIKARVAVAPVGSSLVCVIKNNGVAVSPPMSISSGTTYVEIDSSQMNRTAFEAGSYFTMDVLSVGSEVKGENLSVQLNYVETNGA